MNNEIRCEDCKTLFGRINIEPNGEKVLQIKNRDLYRYIMGGKVWGPCRGCGKRIEWVSPNDA